MKKIVIGLTGIAGSGKSTVASIVANRLPGSVEEIAFAEPIKAFAQVVFGFSRWSLFGPSEAREKALATAKNYWPETMCRFWDLGGAHAAAWLKACGKTPSSNPIGSAFVDWMDGIRRECEKDPSKLTARHICQQLGTDFARKHIQPDVWLRVAQQRIVESTHRVVVVSDVRFDNEAHGLKYMRGFTDRNYAEMTVEIWRTSRGLLNRKPEDFHESERGVATKYVDRSFPNFGTLDALRGEVHDALDSLGLT